MYDRIQGVLPEAIGEGTHIRIPWLQSPAVMDIRTRPRSISSVTGTKGGTSSILSCLVPIFTYKVHPYRAQKGSLCSGEYLPILCRCIACQGTELSSVQSSITCSVR